MLENDEQKASPVTLTKENAPLEEEFSDPEVLKNTPSGDPTATTMESACPLTPSVQSSQEPSSPKTEPDQAIQSSEDIPVEAASIWGFASSAFSAVAKQAVAMSSEIAKDFEEFKGALAEETQTLMDEVRSGGHPYPPTTAPAAEDVEKTEQQTDQTITESTEEDQEDSPANPSHWTDSLQSGLGRMTEGVWSAIVSVSEDLVTLEDADSTDTISATAVSEEELAKQFRVPIPVRSAVFSAKIDAMQQADDTYLSDPQGECNGMDFKSFKAKMETEEQESVVPLLRSQYVRTQYEALVPTQVEDDLFWARYLFRMQILEAEEAKRKRLLSQPQDGGDEDSFSWDAIEENTPRPTISKKDCPVSTTGSSSGLNMNEAASPKDEEQRESAHSESKEDAPATLTTERDGEQNVEEHQATPPTDDILPASKPPSSSSWTAVQAVGDQVAMEDLDDDEPEWDVQW